ncbi:MAG: hypothetical protein KA184_05460 [Candidatus Hydrogenedentes bacterium]|nr:hypothetical protein [Candidatus Hydrogenedentota bacterium]
MISVLCLAVPACACLAGAAAAQSGAQWMDRDAIWLERTDGGVRVHYAVENPGSRTVERQLHFRVADLNGYDLLGKSEAVSLPPGRHERVMEISVPLPEARVPECFLEYRFQAFGGEERAAMRVIDALPQLETRLVASRDFLVGSQASLRIVALDHATQKPVPGAQVEVRLKSEAGERTVLTATTDARGTIEQRFDVPADMTGPAELTARVTAPGLGEDSVTQPVTVQRKTKVLLTSDKPLYQPGQVIHLRALSLDMAAGRPVAERDVVFEVMDAKGNKVFKKTQQTDAFGVASADFQLATEVNLGPYIVRVLLDDVTTEKQVTVDRYVLPKFEVNITTDREYYLPGDTLKGEVQADYFFGKPVAGGKVTLTASKFEIEFAEFASLEGTLDANGHWAFETRLPDYFAGTPLEQGQASVRLEGVVVDTADHREEKVVMKSVAAAALAIHAVPEGGKLRPNLENRVYLLVAYPDGTPAQAAAVTVVMPGAPQPLNIQTDTVGAAEFSIMPADANPTMVMVQARDREGRTAEQSITLEVEGGAESLLLRPEQALYNVGDTLRAEVFATKPAGTVYFDLIRDGQTMMTRTADLENGRAALELDLDATLSGSVILQAYTFTPGTDLLRDARRLYVNPADALRIAVALDAETYKPGDEATLQFSVTDGGGNAAAAALGISIVDESVFALQEIHPGLEKIYFTLEQEIMKPRFEIHGFDIDTLIKEPSAWRPEQQQAARVLLASAPDLPAPPIQVNTFREKEAAANRAIAERIHRDVEHIEKAVAKLLDDEGKPPKDVLKALLRKRLLRENELLDPWGRCYEFDFSNVQEWGGAFSVLSYGPDGLKGTNDDIGPDTPWAREFLAGGGRAVGGGMGGFGGGGADLFFMGEPPMERRMKVFAAMAVPEMAQLDGVAVGGMLAETMPAAPSAAPGAAPVRVREYFPETLLFVPALITDAQGRAVLPLTLADSITTWRMTAMANAANGALGSMDAPIRVFQDFFVDIDLPVALTQHDRVSIPVVLYNYLDTPQDVRIVFEAAPWFTLDGPTEQTINLGPGEVVSRYFPIEVVELGKHKLTVYAYGAKLSDAIRREIEVLPDGEKQEVTFSDRLDADVTRVITIPANAVPGASKILVRVYPGVFTQVVDGLDSMLQMPFGCFEQTSSVTYPNILVVQYMKATEQINPEIQMKAEGFINAGYQRLLSYEVDGGGFSWFGDAPANKVLTAWGVKEFFDMAQVHEVDPNVIARTRDWLFAQQQGDGSWKPDESYLHAESWANIQSGTLLVTAYIAEALLSSGESDARMDKAVGYLRANWQEAKDPYTLGLVANAVAGWNPRDAFTAQVLQALYDLRKEDDKTAHWESEQETVTFSHGNAANIEATALAAIAFLRAGKYPETTTKALTYLIQQKSADGTWGGTQATILALKALILSLGSQTEKASASIAVTINGEEAAKLNVTPDDCDVMRLVDLGDKTRPGDNTVSISFAGEGAMLYQIAGRYFTPWADKPARQDALTIGVAYDKTALAVDDTVTVSVTVTNNEPVAANMVIVDLGIPPGFQVMTPDLDKLVESGVIQKYELTGRQIITYFEKIQGGATLEFSYTIRAKFPLRAQTPPSTVYQYYNPEVRADAQPVDLVVE